MVHKCTFANDDGKDPELMELANAYCKKFNIIRRHDIQRGLLLFGSPGGGKSYAACAICNELLGQGYACRIATIPELTNDLQYTFDKNGYLDELCDIDLIVLDDFGVQRNTSTANELLFEIINRLLLDRVPVIVTTNMSGEELKNPGDTNLQRITSRLFELCIPFEVKGKDRRKDGLRDNYQSFKELLESNKKTTAEKAEERRQALMTAFSAAVENGTAPIAEIAEYMGKNVDTVRRYVKENSDKFWCRNGLIGQL